LLTIYVQDENDNAPRFQNKLDDVFLQENRRVDNITKVKVSIKY